MGVLGQIIFLGHAPSRGKLEKEMPSVYWFYGYFGSYHWKQKDKVEEYVMF